MRISKNTIENGTKIYLSNIPTMNESNDSIKTTSKIKIIDNTYMGDIQDAVTLSNYTDNHFIMQIHNQQDVGSDSPLTMSDSNYNSDDDIIDDDDGESETEIHDLKNNVSINRNYKKLSYNEVERSLNKYYENNNSKYSNILDILITYLNGQKTLYLHSHLLTQSRLNGLTIPCIVLTSIITVLAPFIQTYDWNGGVISGLNAVIFCLVSLIHYLRYESSAELFLHLANQYDKLETSMEMTNNRLTFIENDIEYNKIVLGKIHEFEKQLNDVKESNTVIIPTLVKQVYPIISYINIFSFIKRVETYKKRLIVKLKDVKNEIRYILHKWRTSSDTPEIKKEQDRLSFLYDIKNKIKTEFLYYKNAYFYMDELFTKEIKYAERNKMKWIYYDRPKIELVNNPIIDDYIKHIFIEDKS